MALRKDIKLNPADLNNAQLVAEIKALNLDITPAQLLARFLREKNHVSYSPNTNYPFSIKDNNGQTIELNILLQNKVVCRTRPIPGTQDTEPVYDVYPHETPIGQGSFGKVSNILGLLKHDRENGLVFDTHMERVMKEIAKTDFPIDSKLSQRAEHLRAKLVVSDSGTHYMTMRKFKGRTLLDLLITNELHQLDSSQLITLSINLLYALKEQMHHHGIVHLDIKPGNIMVDPATLAVKIIDVDLSSTGIGKVVFHRGTPGYFPPDDANAEAVLIDPRFDTYSMGVVLGLVWGYPFPADIMPNFAVPYIHNFTSFKFKPPSMQRRPLETEHIRQTIISMTKYQRANRPDDDACIEAFQQIRLARKTARFGAEPQKEKEIMEAYRKANELRHHIKTNKLTPEQMQVEISKTLADVNDTPSAIEEFIETLGVKLLHGLTNKNDINEKLNEVILKFNSRREIINNYLLPKMKTLLVFVNDEAQLAHINHLIVDINRIKNKYDKRLSSADFDYLAEIVNNKRTSTERNKLIEEAEAVLKKLPDFIPIDSIREIYIVMSRIGISKAESDDDKKLIEFKFKIISAIRNYLETKPYKTLSDRRMSDMQDLFKIIEESQDKNLLIAHLKERMAKFSTGLTGVSDLRLRVNSVLTAPEPETVTTNTRTPFRRT